MSLSYTYNGTAFAGSIPPSSLNLTSLANDGEAAFGGLLVDDVAASVLLVGHKAVTVEESACSQPRLFTGWTTDRTMARSEDRGMIVGTDRLHDVNVIDLNALFGFRMIQGAAANRPEESWNTRLAWILGSDYLSGLISDTGHVMTAGSAWTCDATDYRGQYPSSVLNDLLDVSNTYELNYFAFWDASGTAVGLYIGPQDSSIGTSTLSISNDPADSSSTCFFPSEDTNLARKPDQVYSEVTVTYRSGTKRLFRSRQSTASNYIRRGASYDVPRVYSDNRAAIVAEAFLDRHSYEIDQITTTIRVPSSSAGLVQAGQRMVVKFTHLPGYTSATSMRVVECTPTPIDDWAQYYDIRLVLELPQPAGGAGGGCPDPTPSATWGANGSDVSAGDGNIIYWRPGITYPGTPYPGFVGDWHFHAYASKGCDEVVADFAGDLCENRVRIAVVGPGVLTVEMVNYECEHSCPLVATVEHMGPSGTPVIDATYHSPFGEMVVTADGYCNHWIDITDETHAGGSKFGFLSATWVAGENDTSGDQGYTPGSTLGETPDVNVGTAPTDGVVLVYSGSGTAWVAGTPTLDWLWDVGTAGVSDNDVLTYDAATAMWGPAAGGGGTPYAGVATDTIWDAKGDLVVGTAANAAARLPVGADGYVLTADSGSATGLKWAAASSGTGYLADMGEFTYLDGDGTATPGTPASGAARLYAKNGRIYSLDSSGTEYGPFDAASADEPTYVTYSVMFNEIDRTYSLGGNANWPTAGLAMYVPFVLPQNATAYRLYYMTGATVTGTASIDMGIYSSSGVALATSGSAVATGVATSMVTLDITDTALSGDTVYYLGMLLWNISGTLNLWRFSCGTRASWEYGILEQASLTALPGTATFAAPTTNGYIPYCGVLLRSEIT